MLPVDDQLKDGSGRDSGIPQLQPEIWINIIEQLRQPRPLAGTQFYRSSIRQHDLSVMMRVSRDLNKLTAPILYRTIITDDIPQLLKLIEYRGVNRLKGKKELLGITKRLFIEYSPVDLLPTYVEIMADKEDLAWDEVAARIMPEEKQMALIIDTQRLSDKLQVDKQSDLSHLFPNLKTLSVAAHFDDYAPISRLIFRDASPDFVERASRLSQLIRNTVMAGNVDHYCQSDIHGPFSIAPKGNAKRVIDIVPGPDGLLYVDSECANTKPDLLSVHLTSWDHEYRLPLLPAVLGHRTQWCFDDDIYPAIENDRRVTLENARRESRLSRPTNLLAMRSLTMAVGARRETKEPELNANNGHGIDVVVYLPLVAPILREIALNGEDIVSQSLPTHKDRVRAAEQALCVLKEHVKELSVPEYERGLDLSLEGENVSMLPTFDHPGCPACGWAPRRAREGSL